MCARIRQLDESTYNRIAAGEIIHRPANALKELLENSLDAGATNINIIIRDGGSSLLQIQDNGHGIHPDDLKIVCERFTTSKLAKFEDLSTLRTFGFRGEALSSISHIAKLTITSFARGQTLAFRASYIDGKIIGQPPEPQPCAGIQGTIILIEDLFYNILTRKNSLGSANEEQGETVPIIATQGRSIQGVQIQSKETKGDNVFGSTLARELVPFALKITQPLNVSISGYASLPSFHTTVSSSSYTSRSATSAAGRMIIFVNHRLVHCAPLRRAIDDLYTHTLMLPKNCKPFVYVELFFSDPDAVDHNVHPAKEEVRFMNEDAVIRSVRLSIEERMTHEDKEKIFHISSIQGSGIGLDERKGRDYNQQGNRISSSSGGNGNINDKSFMKEREQGNYNRSIQNGNIEGFDNINNEEQIDNESRRLTLPRQINQFQQAQQIPSSSSSLDMENSSNNQISQKSKSLQPTLPFSHINSNEVNRNNSDIMNTQNRIAPQKQVRTDPALQMNALDKYFTPVKDQNEQENEYENRNNNKRQNNIMNENGEVDGNINERDIHTTKMQINKLSTQKQSSKIKTLYGRLLPVQEEAFKVLLDSFCPQKDQSSSFSVTNISDLNAQTQIQPQQQQQQQQQQQLSSSQYLTNVLRNGVFVGFVDAEYLLIQSGTGLFLINMNSAGQQLYYQLFISTALSQIPKYQQQIGVSLSQNSSSSSFPSFAQDNNSSTSTDKHLITQTTQNNPTQTHPRFFVLKPPLDLSKTMSIAIRVLQNSPAGRQLIDCDEQKNIQDGEDSGMSDESINFICEAAAIRIWDNRSLLERCFGMLLSHTQDNTIDEQQNKPHSHMLKDKEKEEQDDDIDDIFKHHYLLHTLPELIPEYQPDLSLLPLILLRLATEVDWPTIHPDLQGQQYDQIENKNQLENKEGMENDGDEEGKKEQNRNKSQPPSQEYINYYVRVLNQITTHLSGLFFIPVHKHNLNTNSNANANVQTLSNQPLHTNQDISSSSSSSSSSSTSSQSSSSSSSSSHLPAPEIRTNLQHKLIPAIFRRLHPLRKFEDDGSITRIADLESFYKIFERC
ncbi:MAG: putative DNA mismatch repair protein Mlh1 [Streblomastix strix]|uniref:Putative DNA mismatch repair protein Mlh1 n=1 Tax=Streblomastix strix TaxID=222440 RepID=A0A5J4WNT0_9EUKA|nr:MAG: putative DNA mismatch repair protein Mlh1 [Streblomastix strix]